MDAVQQANSGHPGMPMGMADIAEVLWNDNLKHNPSNPCWADRDRFVLSNGHGSMLLYSLLHLSGYDLPVSELRNFRQLHSKTPGHPEFGQTPGVETTSGPLGQGLANAVGMALAEKVLANRYNRGITSESVNIGTTIDNPNIDYAKLAQSMGWYAEGPISDPKDLGPAIRRAIAVVERGEPALLDVVTQPR